MKSFEAHEIKTGRIICTPVTMHINANIQGSNSQRKHANHVHERSEKARDKIPGDTWGVVANRKTTMSGAGRNRGKRKTGSHPHL